GREVEQLLELGHGLDLMAAVEDVDALLDGGDEVAVEVRAALLELGEVLDGLHGPLRAEDALDVDAPQGRGLDAVAEFVRANVGSQMVGGVGVAVDVAVEAGHAAAGTLAPPAPRLVELLLRERRHQETQAVELFRIEHLAEQFGEVIDGDELALAD